MPAGVDLVNVLFRPWVVGIVDVWNDFWSADGE